MDYKDYSQVPWYRKSSTNSILLLLGLFFSPAILFVIIVLITGNIYQDSFDQEGNLKTWSKANKIAAVVLLIIQVLFFAAVIFQNL